MSQGSALHFDPALKRQHPIAELTSPCEDAADEAYEQKRLKFTEITDEILWQGWIASVHPVEFCYHGRVATSSNSLLRELEIHDQGLRKASAPLSEAAAETGQRLWLRSRGAAFFANDGYLSCV